ncbi:unnamed protein product [Caretta caretta]
MAGRGALRTHTSPGWFSMAGGSEDPHRAGLVLPSRGLGLAGLWLCGPCCALRALFPGVPHAPEVSPQPGGRQRLPGTCRLLRCLSPEEPALARNQADPAPGPCAWQASGGSGCTHKDPEPRKGPGASRGAWAEDGQAVPWVGAEGGRAVPWVGAEGDRAVPRQGLRMARQCHGRGLRVAGQWAVAGVGCLPHGGGCVSP